jgi:hypothetical protein
MKLTGLLLAILLSASSVFATEMKEWTFLVFMNGTESGLSPYTDKNIGWMASVGSTNQINILVQKKMAGSPVTERIYVAKNNPQTIQSLNNVDMGDYKEVTEFVKWAVQNYPAKHYFIDVWNHGSGWRSIGLDDKNGKVLSPRLMGNFQSHDISEDMNTGSVITTKQLAQAMKDSAAVIGHKVDIYGSDACLMAMGEIAAQMADSVDYFVGSEESEPMDGWPYDQLLKRWVANPTIDGGQVGTILSEEYARYYEDSDGGGIGGTFSAMNLNNLGDFMSALSKFSVELAGKSASAKNQVLNAIYETEYYELSDYRDFYDFVTNLKSSNLGIDKSVMDNVDQTFKKLVIASHTTSSHAKSHGLSMWIPISPSTYSNFTSSYQSLVFDQQTHWATFLTTLF